MTSFHINCHALFRPLRDKLRKAPRNIYVSIFNSEYLAMIKYSVSQDKYLYEYKYLLETGFNPATATAKATIRSTTLERFFIAFHCKILLNP